MTGLKYRRRSTKEADEKCCITNLVETQKNIQWRQALRIAAQSQDRWARKAARQRLKGEQERPAKLWEDDLNEFVKKKPKPLRAMIWKNNKKTCFIVAKKVYEWKKKDNTPNTLSMTEEPDPNLPLTTRPSPATTSPDLQQQHHDEDPVPFACAQVLQTTSSPVSEGADACGNHTCPGLGQSRGRSSFEWTVRTERSSCVVQHTENGGILIWTMSGIRSMPHTRTNGPLTPSQYAKI